MLKELENALDVKKRPNRNYPLPLPHHQNSISASITIYLQAQCFLSINVIQEVNGVFHHTVTDIAVVPRKNKKKQH